MNEGHIIHNFEDLARTDLRRDALAIIESGLQIIDTKSILKQEVSLVGERLVVQGVKYNLADYRRICFIGIGKCAAEAGEFFEALLGNRLDHGIVLDVRGANVQKLSCVIGTHPLPSECNVEASQSIAELLEESQKDDLVLAVVSGGGSALMCLPNDMGCLDIAKITQTLMDSGASIDEINTVRKHTSKIQGGQFAKMAYPATMVAMIFSDVPGNEVATIASGPTVLDETTRDDADAILLKYKIRTLCELPDCEVIETPKGAKYFQKVHNTLLLTNKVALGAMKKTAESLGYDTRIVDTSLEGEAREIGERLAREHSGVKKCRLYGGETTVTCLGKGRGGRNQEVVLGALKALSNDELIASVASDGWDNTDAAGAIVDAQSLRTAKDRGIDIDEHLTNNDSYTALEKMGDQIKTGRTGANVSDLLLTLSS